LAGEGVGRLGDVVGNAAHGADHTLQHPAFERFVTTLVLTTTPAPTLIVGKR